jgi:hypothetical protein
MEGDPAALSVSIDFVSLTKAVALRTGPDSAMSMGVKILAGILLVIVLALWGFNGVHSQQSVGSDDATVQAQMTAVVQPTPSPTP